MESSQSYLTLEEEKEKNFYYWGKVLMKVCKICFKRFSSQRKLNSHIKEVHQCPSHFCEVCNTAFTRKSSLRRHQIKARHQIQCLYCKQMFNDIKNHLEEHALISMRTTLKRLPPTQLY